MEPETLETADEGREYKVEMREERMGGGWGADDEHVTGEGSEIFAVCS